VPLGEGSGYSLSTTMGAAGGRESTRPPRRRTRETYSESASYDTYSESASYASISSRQRFTSSAMVSSRASMEANLA